MAKRKKNDHWLTQSDHWLTQSCTVHVWPKQKQKMITGSLKRNHWMIVIPPELQTSKAVMTAVLFFHFNVIL